MTFAAAPAGGPVMDVTVTDHAIERARERRHFARLTRGEVAGRISFEVQQALEHGRAARYIPVWAVRFRMRELYGGKPRRAYLGRGTQFVWDEQEARGWIVRDENETLVVVTSLHRVRGTREEAAA